MRHLHDNAPAPLNATVVPVFLQAMGSNGTIIDIGTVTSDMSGSFSTLWTPPAESCTYQIIATFEGSESYWRSYATTAIAVLPAPEVVTPEAQPDNTPFNVGIIAAVVVAINIGLVNLM